MPNYWTPFAKKTTALEKIYTPKVIAIIKAFRNSFIQDLQSRGQNVATGNLQQQMAPEALTRLIDSIYRKAGLMGARLTHSEITAIAKLKVVEKKSAGFGRNEQWIQDVIEFLRLHMVNLVQNITETMRGDIVRVLEKATNEGWSIDQIVTELRSQGLIQARARVIARTEIIRAANVGHSVAARSMPYEVDKKWSAARDHRTRHSHIAVNNHTIDEAGTFKVPIYKGDKNTGTFDEMLYPGDATASPSNTVNCRCRAVYLPKRDAQGKLVMRSENSATIIPMRPVSRYTPAQIAAIRKELYSNITISVGDEK